MKKWPHEELEVWQMSMDLVDKVYDLTETFPKDERYGLIGQVRRAAVSIANNIAEGKGIIVRTGLGNLAVQYLQLEGKKVLDSDSFVRGHRIVRGYKFGSV